MNISLFEYLQLKFSNSMCSFHTNSQRSSIKQLECFTQFDLVWIQSRFYTSSRGVEERAAVIKTRKWRCTSDGANILTNGKNFHLVCCMQFRTIAGIWLINPIFALISLSFPPIISLPPIFKTRHQKSSTWMQFAISRELKFFSCTQMWMAINKWNNELRASMQKIVEQSGFFVRVSMKRKRISVK